MQSTFEETPENRGNVGRIRSFKSMSADHLVPTRTVNLAFLPFPETAFMPYALNSTVRCVSGRFVLMSSILRTIALIAIIMPIVLASPRASAQVGIVPDPITTPDLQPIIETLGLSDQQAMNLLPLHDAYKDRYRAFLDTDVKKLTDQLVEIGLKFTRGAFEIPERKVLEGIVADFKKLLDKARSLDRGFFTEIGSILAEDQMPKLERARINRELLVFRQILGGVGEMNRGAGVNLAEITRRLDMSPQEREQVEPVLNDYESVLLAKSTTIYNVLTDAAKVVLDFIDEIGIRNMTMEQMITMAQNPQGDTIMRAQSVFDEASKPIQEAAFDVSQLNMRTYKRLAPLLSADLASELRDRYFRRAYREIYQSSDSWDTRYRVALQLEELSEEQRTALTEQQTIFAMQFDSAVDGGVNALEATRKYKTFRQFSQQDPDPARDKVTEAAERCKSISESAISTLNTIIGAELVAKIDEKLKKDPEITEQRRARVVARAQSSRGSGAGAGAGGATGGGEPVQVEVKVNDVPPDLRGFVEEDNEQTRYLPQPLGVKQYQQTLVALNMGEDDRNVAMTLLDAYRADYDQLRTAEMPIKKEGEEATPAETGKARAARHDELVALDQQLFDDVALLVQDDASKATLQMLRQTRMRDIETEVAKSMAQSFGDDESYIDLVALVVGSDLSTQQRQQAVAALNEYDSRIAPEVAQRLSNAREVQRRSESMQRAGRRGGGGGPPRMLGGGGGNQAMEFAMDKWREARKSLSETNDKIKSVNRELIDQLAAAMPADAAWQIRLAYNQAAYPDIYRDDRSADKVLKGALEIPDLDDAQRDRLNNLIVQYRADFYAMCDQMVGLRKQRDFDMFAGQMPKKDDIDREIDLEKLRWNRNEISARARLQLTLILTDDQAKVLPELQSK